MANIDLKGEQALDVLGTITEKKQLLFDSCHDLQSNLDKINAAWESTGQDKASYIDELEALVSKMSDLAVDIGILESEVRNYVENNIANSQRTM